MREDRLRGSLEEARDRLVEAHRQLDGAFLKVRAALAHLDEARKQAPYIFPVNDNQGGDDEQ